VRRAVEALEAGAARLLGRALDAHEVGLFEKYLLLLQKWQRVHRLVGSSDPGWIVEHLLLDSLLFLRVLPSGILSIADLGSGAGLPGIPLKIVRADLHITLIESRQRRISFLATVIRELGLMDIKVLAGRAEDLRGQIGTVEAVVARCAGDAEEILTLGASLICPGGVVIVSSSPGRVPGRGMAVKVPGTRPGATRSFVVFQP
jgi:16S rRNA (guanine527-N7)-methyltransferase